MKFKYGVVLTGGIATGKSTVSNIFQSYGVEIIDADKIGHYILDLYAKEINNLFEMNVIENNKINRKKLGEIIFSNISEREKLNNFIHPKIKKEIINQAIELEKKKSLYLLDIPLYYETNNYNEFNRVIVVYTTQEKQLSQLMNRNGFSKEEATKRINSQLNIEEKKNKGTYVIENIKDLDNLNKECQVIFNEIKV